ncbi:MAG: alpha/beta fold hydrolase, partial [SAR202 cluster bacterium]|nr:alpha/beta fold hydrolase [SAR202 cluster bacterium]
AIKKALSQTGAEKLSITAVCLGVPITASYLALTPDAPVRNLVAMVGPIDFNQGGMFKSWVGSPAFPAESLVNTWGGVPTSAMGLGFKLLRPLGDTMAYSGLMWNLDNPAYLPTFQALNDWSNDFIQMPGHFFQQLSRDLYRDNLLIKGQFRVGGRLVDLKNITLPILTIAAAQDHIAPAAAARALMDAVSSKDKEYVELPGGHISVFAGRRASRQLFPQVNNWLAVRTPLSSNQRG